jgi:hypothetical protein
MNTPGFEASTPVREEPQRNANGAYLCATCYLLHEKVEAATGAELRKVGAGR